jgi:uncharacterized protein
MFRKEMTSSSKGFGVGHRLDIIHSIYRTIGDLKMLRHIGVRDMISSLILPLTPTSAKSYHDFFEWFVQDAKRCAKFNINLHVVIGIPPAGKVNPKIIDEALLYLEKYCETKRIVGIGEIGMGNGTKEEFITMKRQLSLASKYNLPVIISAPERDRVANISIILKELKKSHVTRAIIDHCDGEILQLLLRSHNDNIKAGFSVGQQAVSPEEALRTYKNYSYPDRILFNSGLGLKESSLFGLSNTFELFEEDVSEDVLKKMFYSNYLDVFQTITSDIKISNS